MFCYRVPSSLYDNTNPDWGQSQNIGHDKVKNTNLACERDARAKERSRKRKIEEEEAEQAKQMAEEQPDLQLCELRIS